MNPPLYFVTGGCRSGKSSFAQSLAEELALQRLFVATAEARDEAMAERIQKHKNLRDSSWTTLEIKPGFFSRFFEQKVTDDDEKIGKAVELYQASKGVILFDCLTLFVSGEMESGLEDSNLHVYMDALLQYLFSFSVPIIIVSNEVGLGGIALSPFGRAFCDVVGLANQYIAKQASTAILIVSGMPVVMKGTLPPCFVN